MLTRGPLNRHAALAGQPYFKSSSSVGRTLHANSSVVKLHDSLTYGEPETYAGSILGFLRLIEFIKEPGDLANFQERLDEILRSINSDYDAKRFDNLILKPLTVGVLKNNTMEKWLEIHNRKTVQAKIPKLWKDDSIQKQLRAIEHS